MSRLADLQLVCESTAAGTRETLLGKVRRFALKQWFFTADTRTPLQVGEPAE
jgi:hypothetical protein